MKYHPFNILILMVGAIILADQISGRQQILEALREVGK